jgi:hypothetical protein
MKNLPKTTHPIAGYDRQERRKCRKYRSNFRPHKKSRSRAAFYFAQQVDNYASITVRTFFIAFFSSWRMRSADTPNSAANSCKVDLLSSSNQRC